MHGERMQFLVHSKSRASARTVILLSHDYMYMYMYRCLMDARSKLSKLEDGKNGNDAVSRWRNVIIVVCNEIKSAF